MTHNSHLEKIKAGTVAIVPLEQLQQKLASGKRLIIKLGADPTSADLHLGHAVVLSKMRDFQDLGHEIIFLIGDYTARIGDPSLKSKTRPPLTHQEIEHNMQTYFAQVSRILDPAKTTVVYNSTWLDKLTSTDFLKLCAKVTLAQLIERDDFAKRIKEQKPIGFHELLYPLLQAYDSVILQADVELGGTDQTFNLMLGRNLQEQSGQSPQVVITMPLLEGLDGVQKMSKSLNNFVGLNDDPRDAFGKLMSISDQLMWRYFAILLGVAKEKITDMMQAIAQETAHPMELKKQMAHGIVAKFWSSQAADDAQHTFQMLFQKKDLNAAQEITIANSEPIWIIDLLKKLNVITTNSQGRRLIEQGAVFIDGQRINNATMNVTLRNGMIVKAGKHQIFKVSCE